MLSHTQYLALVKQLATYATAYYSEDAPLISDTEYDELLQQAIAFETANPLLMSPDSPTQSVGSAALAHFEQFQHSHRLPSLGNVFDRDELERFVERIQAEFPDDSQIEFTVEPKIDGLAVACHYENGRFTVGATRGDGSVGENVSHNLATIKSLPKQLPQPLTLEIRGEVFIRRSIFRHMADRYANPRNTAAGALRQLNARKTAEKRLDFFAYQGLLSLPTHSEIIRTLHSLTIPTIPDIQVVTGVDAIWSTIQAISEKRDSFDWEIDGVVIKVNRQDYQKRLGNTAKAPRWATAFKFKAAQGRTKLLSVTVQVGRTGILTPVAELEPVLLAGTRISRATLHNWEDIARKQVKIGDEVVIQRAGDVIPEVVQSAQTFPESIYIPIPTHCPDCQTPVTKIEGEVAIRCPNSLCPSQTLGRIIHYCSRNALDISGLGEAVITQLLAEGLIEDIPDLYRLQKDQIAPLERFADKSAEKLIVAIQNAKAPALDKFIFGLGIPFVGARTAQVLADNYRSLARFRSTTAEELLQIHEIGDKIANSIIQAWQSPSFSALVDDLVAQGVTPSYTEQSSQNSAFSQKTCLLTGSLDNMSRIEAESKVIALGGRIVSGVSKTLNFLIVGDSPGSKLDKAIAINAKLGPTIQVLNEGEFMALLNPET